MNVEVRLAKLTERISGIIVATKLQANEYERRLEDLNHEAARILAVADRTVSSEKFDDYVRTQAKALELSLSAVDARIDELQGKIEQLYVEERASQALREERTVRHAWVTQWQLALVGFVSAVLVLLIGIWFAHH